MKKVRARWTVKDATGWHNAGEVFETSADLGNAVEVLDAPKPAKKAEPAKAPEKEPEKESAAEPEAETPKARSTARRKVAPK